MHRIQIDQDIQPLSEFRSKVAFYFDKVKKTKRPLIITQNGKSSAILLDVSEYQSMVDKIEVLEDIFEYISKDNLSAAQKLVEKIFKKVETLSINPTRGRKVPEANREEIREVFEGEYRIIYRLGSKKFQFLRLGISDNCCRIRMLSKWHCNKYNMKNLLVTCLRAFKDLVHFNLEDKMIPILNSMNQNS